MSQIGQYTVSLASFFVKTMTGNSGGAVGPTAGNIDILGDGTLINIVGTPASSTLTVSVGGSIPARFNADTGFAVPALNILHLDGSLNIATSASGDTVTFTLDDDVVLAGSLDAGTTVTAGTGVIITTGGLEVDAGGIDATGTIRLRSIGGGAGVVFANATGVLSDSNGANGELIIGGGGAPAWASLSSSGGTVTITNGLNSINLETSGSGAANCLCFDVQKGSPGTINIGEVVYLTGFDNGAGVPEVELARANNSATMPAIGIAMETITNSVSGMVTAFGNLSGLNTNAWNVGDQLYVSPSTAGQLTSTRPTGLTEVIQPITEVLRKHPSQGVLQVVSPSQSVESPNTISIPGNITSTANAITAQTGLTTNTGNVTVSAGNISIPATNGTGTQGVITGGGTNRIHFYANDVMIGSGAGNFTRTGNFNIGIGQGNILSSLTIGGQNIGIGNDIMSSATSPDGCIGIGYTALHSLTTGDYNLAIGDNTLSSLTTGSNNTVLGQTSGNAYTGAESSNLLFKNTGVIGESNTIRIGTNGAGAGQQNRCFVAGVRGITTGVADAIAVLIDSAHQLGTISSSLRVKKNIEDMGIATDDIFRLRPVLFDYINSPSERRQYGLIAEEVEKIMPDLVVYDKENMPESVRYHELPVMLLNELKKMKQREDELLSRIEKLESMIEKLVS